MEDLTKQSIDEVVDRLARFTLERKHGNRVYAPAALRSIVVAIDSPPGDTHQAALQLPSSDEVTLDDALSALLLIPDERRVLDMYEVALIEAAMDRGATWEQVGSFYRGNSAAGVSRQSAQRRYRRLGGQKTWPTRRPAADLPADHSTAADQ